jgi:hypothetical protein
MLEAASTKVKWYEMTWNEVNVRPKPCAVPRLTVCLHWEAKLMGRDAYTRICKWKVMVGSPHTECGKSGPVNPDGLLQMLWHKCTTSAECRSIRIAASSVMDGWNGHTVPSSDHFQNVTCEGWLEFWTWKVNGELDFESQLSCGNDTNVPTWVSWANEGFWLLKCLWNKTGFLQMKLELSIPFYSW